VNVQNILKKLYLQAGQDPMSVLGVPSSCLSDLTYTRIRSAIHSTSQESGQGTYLIQRAANRTFAPGTTAEVYELLAQLGVGVLGEAIVDAGQFLSKEALLSAMTTERTPAGLMLGCVGLQRVCRLLDFSTAYVRER
jgi:hypothetical protein